MTILTDEEMIQYRVKAETDMVVVYNRVMRPIEWCWNSTVHTLPEGGNKIVARAAAISGINTNVLKQDYGTHAVTVSALGMKELNGDITGYPVSLITAKEEARLAKEIADSMLQSSAFPGKKLEAVAVLG